METKPKAFWNAWKLVFFIVLLATVVAAFTGILFVVFRSNADGDVEVKFLRPSWGYKCKASRCVRYILDTEDLISLSACQITCGGDWPNTVWPRTTTSTLNATNLVQLNMNSITFNHINKGVDAITLDECEQRFRKQLHAKAQKGLKIENKNGVTMTIEVFIVTESLKLDMSTDERYRLSVQEENDRVVVKVHAPTYYGARHGLETLAQLIVYDEIKNIMRILTTIEITDEPVFKHRGLHLDTSRNFFSVAAIKRTIDAMAMTKLNVFHWHITDTHSFPMEIKSHPEFTELGAYSPYKIYTANDIADLVKYARVRGVQIIPEFDQPAHIGEGWQTKSHLLTCYNAQPWQDFCVEPPCGQLDPSSEEVYDILEDIYADMYEMFNHPSIFHMGGDEISFTCWNQSIAILSWMREQGWEERTEENFMKLWNHFQVSALKRFDKISGFQEVPIILWTSHLTQAPYVSEYLDKTRYIIQIWVEGNDPDIQVLLELGYNLILSNVDALYLDCGFAGWVTDGLNWCEPYKGWHTVYENRPSVIAGAYVSQILGAEAALWTEQTDDSALDSRLWPRLSALGERLWSDPETTWREADTRLLIHRARLVENGIAADRLQPEWCSQNDNQCPLDPL